MAEPGGDCAAHGECEALLAASEQAQPPVSAAGLSPWAAADADATSWESEIRDTVKVPPPRADGAAELSWADAARTAWAYAGPGLMIGVWREEGRSDSLRLAHCPRPC